MESLIPIINQLQDVCNAVKTPLPIDLPQIVVVGAQSHGKSSVIESIVKREFLPRGAGLVTRRPLVIRLFKLNNKDQHQQGKEWVKFNHSDKEFTDFDEVREEIERETDRVCGTNKGITSEPITLSVYSKNVVNLTLVDLPGLTKNPVGDQPPDIEIQIQELVLDYIKNPNSIILAVTAGNTDLETSDAIKLARGVDPDGRRTIAVLTKLDILDRGTDALNVLSGRRMRIRLGIIGVVNRSQQDIDNKKSIDEAIADEAAFFQRHYPTIAEKNGQPFLSRRLSQLLMRHIRDCLPDLEERVNSLISQYHAQLNSYGDGVTDKAQKILDILRSFSDTYCDLVEGKKPEISTTELCGSARLEYIFKETFGKALTAINPLDSLDNKAIFTATRNAKDVGDSICVPHVFKFLMIKQIRRLRDPSVRCVELVHKELQRFGRDCGDEVHLELLRFPKLREKIEEILAQLLRERLPVTREAVSNLISWRSKFINQEIPKLKPSYSPEQPMQNGGDDSNMHYEWELRECEIIAQKINAHFNIVREEITNFVPGAIMDCMVDYIKSNLHNALLKEIYRPEMFDEMLSESDDIARKRKETADMLTSLERASEIINSIHDLKQPSQ